MTKGRFLAVLWSVTAIASSSFSFAMPQILAGVISSSAQGLRQEWICRSTNIAYASVSAGSPPFSMRAQRA